MSDYKPQKGDRVRVVVEGEITGTYREGQCFNIGHGPGGMYVTPHTEHVVSVEKLEPPVEVFKPGDVVRYKFGPRRYVYTIATGGYVDHEDGVYLDAAGDLFTSRSYEKIDLG